MTDGAVEPDAFDVSAHRLPGIDYLVIRGELDLHNVYRLRRALDPDRCTEPTLLLDLAGMSFIDSTGISELAATHRATQARGTHLVIACGARTLQVLAMVGLVSVLDVQPSAEAYLTARGVEVPSATA